MVLSTSGGNLNSRRGPGQAYDIVGFLLNGQSSPGTGRNEPSPWVTIAIPDKPGASGWISVDSGYVGVAPTAGALQSLGILTADPAKLAYLRSCTLHPMAIDPGSFSSSSRRTRRITRSRSTPASIPPSTSASRG